MSEEKKSTEQSAEQPTTATSIFDTAASLATDALKTVAEGMKPTPNKTSKAKKPPPPSKQGKDSASAKGRTNPMGSAIKNKEILDRTPQEDDSKSGDNRGTGKTKLRPLNPIENAAKAQSARYKHMGYEDSETESSADSRKTSEKHASDVKSTASDHAVTQTSNMHSSLSFFAQNEHGLNSQTNVDATSKTNASNPATTFNPSTQPALKPSAEQMPQNNTPSAQPTMNIPGFNVPQAAPTLQPVNKDKLAADMLKELEKNHQEARKNLDKNNETAAKQIKQTLDAVNSNGKTVSTQLKPALTAEEYKALVKQLANLFATLFGVLDFSTDLVKKLANLPATNQAVIKAIENPLKEAKTAEAVKTPTPTPANSMAPVPNPQMDLQNTQKLANENAQAQQAKTPQLILNQNVSQKKPAQTEEEEKEEAEALKKQPKSTPGLNMKLTPR